MSFENYSTERLKTELERYKSLYEHEKEQFEEYEKYSKDLETEMDMELSQANKKCKELSDDNKRLLNELSELKKRYNSERQEFLQTENSLTSKLKKSEEICIEYKTKLREVEQTNDDLERRDRIQVQEIQDWVNRYEKCLERCAFLEAGIFMKDEEADALSMSISSGVCSSEVVMTDRTNIPMDEPTAILYNGANHSTLNGPKNNNDIDINSNKSTPIRNGFKGYTHGSSNGKKNSITSFYTTSPIKERQSAAIVTSLLRKIEEVEKQVDPKKYAILRTPNRNYLSKC